MKKIFLAICLVGGLAAAVAAQQVTTDNRASSKASAQKQGRQLDLQSGTQIAAQLEGTLDARHAKPGDRVVLKTTKAVKQNGEVVIERGSRLIGRVTDVQQQTKKSGESQIGLVFDRLRSGSTEIPITASIVSITQAQTRAQTANTDFENDTMARSTTTASARSAGSGNSGGLLGGVGNTVGGVVNGTTSTVGNVAGTTTNAVGSTVGATTSSAGNLTGSLRGLQITQSSSASAEGGSTLSLAGGNLRLESGTTFNLAVSNSASAGAQ